MSRTSGLFNGLPRVCQILGKLRSDILMEGRGVGSVISVSFLYRKVERGAKEPQYVIIAVPVTLL